MMGRHEEALQLVSKARTIDPLTVAYYNYQIVSLYLLNRHEEALTAINEALQLSPSVLRLYDFRARIYLSLGRYDDTVEAVRSGLSISTIRPPSMVAYLAAAYAGLEEETKTKDLLDELILRSKGDEKRVNIYFVHVLNAIGNITLSRILL